MRTFKSELLISFILFAALPSAAWSALAPRAAGVGTNYRFALYVDRELTGYFTEVSGLGSEHEVVEYREGSDASAVIHKLPGAHKYDNIVLKRGLIKDDTSLWDWRAEMVEKGLPDASRDGSIVLLDQAMQPIATWNFSSAWPLKITVPPGVANSDGIPLEEFTLVVEYIERVQ